MDNKEKCNNYEAFFVFRNEEDFNNHLEECSDCRQEHEKYLKVSKLVKEVAPVYLEKKKREKTSLLKRAACFLIVLTGFIGYTGYNAYQDNSFQVNSVDESYINTMGLPTDDYGFLEL